MRDTVDRCGEERRECLYGGRYSSAGRRGEAARVQKSVRSARGIWQEVEGSVQCVASECAQRRVRRYDVRRRRGAQQMRGARSRRMLL